MLSSGKMRPTEGFREQKVACDSEALCPTSSPRPRLVSVVQPAIRHDVGEAENQGAVDTSRRLQARYGSAAARRLTKRRCARDGSG